MDHPRDDDTVTYTGTAVIDPALTSALPILQWFITPQDYQELFDHKDTDITEPCVLFFDGQIYDGVEVRMRGQSSRAWPKPPWKFFFPQGHHFKAPDLIDRAVDTFNLQSNYSDKSYMREILAWESFRDAGSPFSEIFSMRVEMNGTFFGLFSWLEAADNGWLKRNELDTAGSFYKAFDDLRERRTPLELEDWYEKQTRLFEDYTDLYDLTRDLTQLSVEQMVPFLYDNIDIPSMLNYIAVHTLLHSNDHVKKNYFIYRDTEGTQRWELTPWDLDLTFGRNWIEGNLLIDTIWADEDSLPGYPAVVSPSHPLFGSSEHQKVNGVWNRLIDRVLLYDDTLREMYFRRLRSVMDFLLIDGRYESRIDELIPLIAPEADLDRQIWQDWGEVQDLTAAVNVLKNDYLAMRRVHLYTTHSICDIPPAQSALPRVVINEIMYQPPGGVGGADDEYVELYNTLIDQAVDISGWRLDGVALTFPPGTVIPAGGYLLVVKKDPQFRAVYGGGKYIAADYTGSLSDLGESLTLRNEFGAVISSVIFDGRPATPRRPPERRIRSWVPSRTYLRSTSTRSCRTMRRSTPTGCRSSIPGSRSTTPRARRSTSAPVRAAWACICPTTSAIRRCGPFPRRICAVAVGFCSGPTVKKFRAPITPTSCSARSTGRSACSPPTEPWWTTPTTSPWPPTFRWVVFPTPVRTRGSSRSSPRRRPTTCHRRD
jgi:hypothetical protein